MTSVLPPLIDNVTLYRADVSDVLDALQQRGTAVDFVHVDAPWQYRNFSAAVNGAAKAHYDGIPLEAIAGHMASTYDIAAKDAYLAFWVTFPKLMEWASMSQAWGAWEYVTGGSWGKTHGLGVGFHVRGDSELLLIYKKGNPSPRTTLSNLWLSRRVGHSEKPQNVLRDLVRVATAEDGVVLDLYAGASASCARACRLLGRRYIGAEIDPIRHAQAMQRLALADQADLWGNEVESDVELVS